MNQCEHLTTLFETALQQIINLIVFTLTNLAVWFSQRHRLTLCTAIGPIR